MQLCGSHLDLPLLVAVPSLLPLGWFVEGAILLWMSKLISFLNMNKAILGRFLTKTPFGVASAHAVWCLLGLFGLLFWRFLGQLFLPLEHQHTGPGAPNMSCHLV